MHKNRVMILMIALSMALSQLAGCGEKKPEELPVVQEKAEEPDATSEGADVKTAETATTEETDREEPAGEEPVEEVPVDEEWQKILLDNGTLYDAIYALPTIMETESPDHPDEVKLPAGLSKLDYSYYDKEIDHSDLEPADMEKVTGFWIPTIAKIMDIESDFTPIIEAGVDKHLLLNEDGTGSCCVFDEDSGVTWTPEHIHMNKPLEVDWLYKLEDDNNLTLWYVLPGGGKEWEFRFVRKQEDNDDADTPAEEEPSGDLGTRLTDAKLYRLKARFEDGNEFPAKEETEGLDPAECFVVLKETDKEQDSGFGYVRGEGVDTPFYYQLKRGLAKGINENTADRSRGMDHTRFERDGDLIRLWADYQHYPEIWQEYVPVETEEEIPLCHEALGPVPDREFDIPEGTHDQAGFYHLDRISMYMIRYKDIYYETDSHSTDVWSVDDAFVYGTDTRKYDADFWYVLDEDGTGYMRIWRKYFELAWCDDEIYYYDASGRHKLGNIPGEIDFDSCFCRLFKDEINPVPERPEELGGPGGFRK